MRVYLPLRDAQREAPTGRCVRCGWELYRYDEGPLCPVCRAEGAERGSRHGAQSIHILPELLRGPQAPQ